MKASIPLNEHQRLADLYQYEILDTAAEQEFDDLVKLASYICNTPISLISLVDANRQWFKAKIGVDEAEMPRDISFCSHGILNGNIFIVPDATRDERFADNPMVTGSHGIRFYAGVPLTSQDGNNLGMLCVKNTMPGTLTQQQQEALIMLGKQVVKQIELRLRNKELERIAQAQRRIISIIAHDVRSPLSSVISLFHLYENKIIDPERFNEFLKISSTQLQSTKVLLENLVEWGRIQLNEQPLVLTPINLKEQVQRVFTELTVQASFKSNQLINAVHEATQVSMEENTLRFILRNLLTNANKFTENGRITIDASGSENKLVIRVIDTGIGMPAAMRERLFLTREKYSRRGTQNESGSGLGLVLIKEFIEKNGGAIRVESTEGIGSTFMIELPVSAPLL